MKKLLIALCVLTCLCFSSCGNEYTEESFFCMDTLCTVKAQNANKETMDGCRTLLEKLDSTLSRHNNEGLPAQFKNAENSISLSEDIALLIDEAERLNRETDGAFSVMTGGLTSLWENSLTYPLENEINNALQGVLPVVIKSGVIEKSNGESALEFGGIAKGYACDRAVVLLKNKGVDSAMISFSSSIGVIGSNPKGQPWKIAVKDPADRDKHLGYIELEGGFLSVSGDYERFYEIEGEKYNHIIDPRNGYPVDNGVHSVVAVCDTGAKSDAYSTAFFVLGADRVEELYGDSKTVKYLIVTDNGVFMNDAMKEIFTPTE